MSSALSMRAPSGVTSELTFRPMPFEVDFTGFLSNTVAPRWMEALRVSLMDRHFPHFDSGAPEHLSVIAETQIKYLKPGRYGDVICGRAWIESTSCSRWVIAFRFDFQEGATMLRGRQVGAFVHPETLMPVRIPDAIRELIASSSHSEN
jgi:acyl-CoA thioester hydrolase